MSKHKHHIIPRYKCEELGIDPDFDDNFVEVTREQHALIHWGYKCNDLSPLLEVCNPPQNVIDMIPLGDNRDMWAAQLLAEGEIGGIDISGENNPQWKGGVWANDPVAYMKEYHQTPESKAYEASPERKAKKIEHQQAKRDKNKAETGFVMGYSQAKKKAESQGAGSLDAFLK